jgi:hypothetical protein
MIASALKCHPEGWSDKNILLSESAEQLALYAESSEFRPSPRAAGAVGI